MRCAAQIESIYIQQTYSRLNINIRILEAHNSLTSCENHSFYKRQVKSSSFRPLMKKIEVNAHILQNSVHKFHFFHMKFYLEPGIHI